ncbi:hypothetical protein Lal_00036624 [Lupinus albus]|nr:hypothetical protein Lal_00036624 [Lupinus albus]
MQEKGIVSILGSNKRANGVDKIMWQSTSDGALSMKMAYYHNSQSQPILNGTSSRVEVTWKPPRVGWIKVNTDGATNGSPGQAGGGGIFRDFNGVFIAFFASYLEIQDALYAKLYLAMKVIHMAYKRGWWNLWLECDCSLVVDIFNDVSNAPWKLQNEWLTCKLEISHMNFCISHIYREGNSCDDKLASYGIVSRRNFIWFNLPIFLSNEYHINRLGLPSCRFHNL